MLHILNNIWQKSPDLGFNQLIYLLQRYYSERNRDIAEEDVNPKPDDRPGISASERQWLQVEKIQKKDK